MQQKHEDEALLSGVCKVKYDHPRCTAASPHVEKHDLLTLTHWRALGLRPGDWSTASIVPLLVLTGYWRLLAISVIQDLPGNHWLLGKHGCSATATCNHQNPLLVARGCSLPSK